MTRRKVTILTAFLICSILTLGLADPAYAKEKKRKGSDRTRYGINGTVGVTSDGHGLDRKRTDNQAFSG